MQKERAFYLREFGTEHLCGSHGVVQRDQALPVSSRLEATRGRRKGGGIEKEIMMMGVDRMGMGKGGCGIRH